MTKAHKARALADAIQAAYFKLTIDFPAADNGFHPDHMVALVASICHKYGFQAEASQILERVSKFMNDPKNVKVSANKIAEVAFEVEPFKMTQAEFLHQFASRHLELSLLIQGGVSVLDKPPSEVMKHIGIGEDTQPILEEIMDYKIGYFLSNPHDKAKENQEATDAFKKWELARPGS